MIEKIALYLRQFIATDQVTELRAFGVGRTLSGWFDGDHLDLMARSAMELSRSGCHGIYFVPNPIKPETAKAMNTVGIAGKTTSDGDILERRWLLIDVDPVRPAGTNATDAEAAAAWNVACNVRAVMDSQGFGEPVTACSGNGWHLNYPISMPNDAASRDKVRQLLYGLADRCNDAGATVDIKTANASRIWKLYGTEARKGPATPERPHRRSYCANLLEDAGRDVGQNVAAVETVLTRWNYQEAVQRKQEAERPGTSGGNISRARAYIQRIPGAVSGANGHGATFHAAMCLVEGFSLQRGEALSLLAEWNTRCVPPWSDSELAHKVDSAIGAAQNFGWLLTGPAVQPQAAAKVTAYTGPDSVLVVPGGEDETATAEDLMEDDDATAWLWPGWIQRGALTCFASEPGTGKTRTAMDLARRLALGLPWPDGTDTGISEGARVMWVASDNQWQELKDIPKDFGFSRTLILLNSTKANKYSGTMLDAPEDLAAFERRIISERPEIVFVDTVNNVTDRATGRPEEAKALFKPLADIAVRTGSAIICVTHLNAAGKPLNRRIEGQVRQVIVMTRPDEDQVNKRLLAVTKSSAKYPDPLAVVMGDGGNEYSQTVEKKSGKPSVSAGDAEWLRVLLAEGHRPVSIIRSLAEEAGISAPRLYRAKDAAKLEEFKCELNRKWWRLPDA
jgi:hypothetical protein